MLLPFPELIRKHNIKPKGVIHVGGNRAQEMQWYADNGVLKTVWVEADPDVYKDMREVLSKYKNTTALQACISDVSGQEVDFNVSSNGGESSSIFDFGSHLTYHPDVSFVGKKRLKTIRLDTLLISKGINVREFDFLNIDVQGADGLVLKSLGDMLRLFKYVYIEVNKESLYQNIMLVDEIDAYLSDFGFKEADVKWTGANWGDKFYIKQENMNSVFRRQNFKPIQREGIVNVPNHFMPQFPFPYPSDNTNIFEHWYYEDYKEVSERLYLPIQFTAYHVSHSFGEDKAAVKKLQDYIDTLERNKKYYTICQFDLGCMVDFKDLDVLVFGMAGGRIDYPLPLLSVPHKYKFDNPRTLFATFVGRKTHPVREKVFANLQHRQGCYVSDHKHDLSAYCSLLASSVFSLCPRGFGNNSFRLQESLQYGAIPVIISNERLEPHNIPFEEYGYYIDESDADKIYEILQEKTVDEITEKQSKLKHYFDNYFTYNENKNLILKQLKK